MLVVIVVSECPDPADIVIALDSSGSVGIANFYTMLDFVKYFTDSLNVGHTRVGLETFSTDVDIKFHLNEHERKDELMNAIR